MKKSYSPRIWHLLLLCLFSWACGPKIDTGLPPKTADCSTSIVPKDRLSCCSDRGVSEDCANQWLQTWTQTYQAAQGFGATYPAQGYVLANTSVQELLALCPACSGVRVYFGFEYRDGDSLLCMMVVNLDSNCNDVYAPANLAENSGILYLSSQASERRYISRDSAELIAAAWESLFAPTDPAPGFEGFALIQAYNYARSVIDSLTAAKNDSITFQIAVHNVPVNDPVYMLDDSALVQDILVQRLTGNGDAIGEYFDFAMPCPNFCGKLNLTND